MNPCQINGTSMSDSGTDILFRELSNRFPEVPADVVTTLMQENLNNRQKCIEELARVSSNYLYGHGDIGSEMGRMSLGNNTTGTVPYNQGYDSSFRGRSDSVGSLSAIGNQGVISTNAHTAQQTTHVSTAFQRVDGNYSNAGQSMGYDQQGVPRRQHVQIHISARGQTHGHGYNDPSHSLTVQTHRGGGGQLPHSGGGHHSGGQMAWPEEPWNGDAQYHPHQQSHHQLPPQPPPQYAYHQPPHVQRHVNYGSDTGWPAKMHNGPSRPHGFCQGFPVSNGPEAVGSSPEAANSGAVSSFSNKGTPNTPPSGLNSQVRYAQSPEDVNVGSGTIDYTSQSHNVIGSNGQYLQRQSISSGPIVNNTNNTTNQNNTTPTYQSLMYIPSPQMPARTPSPIHPTPPNAGFFPGQPMGGTSTIARPPQSLPPFPPSSQRSSDSSPGTPRHQQYHNPSVPHMYASPTRQQQSQHQKRHRVAFQIPDNSLVHGEELVHPGYQVHILEGGQGGYPGGQVQETRPSRSGSIEDSQYMQTLLEYQRERKAKLNEDLQETYETSKLLQAQVGMIEKNILERRKIRTVTAEDIQKIRQENRRLQVEIQLLTREIDVVNNGQTPLGVLDTHQLQSFYKNIEPGQRVSSQNNSRPSTPPRRAPPRPPPPPPSALPPSSSQHVVPHPTPTRAAPLAPREVDRENWMCSACTFLNHPDLDKCEMCEMPRLDQ